ncbi:MAG: helix-turn-helix domain-containing protein [Candidatus Gracilibacteria bacterium]|nr:helix-turn-helix domain-containing protein [Candidatus Gracilibacteria bacterium]
MDLLPHLMSLGLTEKEAKLYLTLLEIGSNPVSSIARKAGITRTTAYAALETLKEKGLVSTIEKGGIQQFTPVKPSKLEKYAKKLREDATSNYERIKEIIPNLKSLTGDLVMAPKVKFFEGLEGIKTIYSDTIETLTALPKGDRIKYSYSSAPEVTSELRNFLDSYIAERVSMNINAKIIMPDSKLARDYKKNSKKRLSQLRLVPKDIDTLIKSEIAIYDSKVAIMSLKAGRLHGVIIDSPEIAATEKAVFELAWRGCE